jgi:hypothetical protein
MGRGQVSLAVALVPNTKNVPVSTWATLNSWCVEVDMVLAVQVRSFTDLPLPLPNCTYVHVSEDGLVVSTTRNRVRRLGAARRQQRRMLLPAIHHLDIESVIVFDMDVELPAAREMRTALSYLKTWDVLCANGYELNEEKRPQVYDTFPLVLRDGAWMFEHLGVRQETLFREIESTDGPYRVRHCFGGLALYRAAVWKRSGCTYTTRPSKYTTADGLFCEHLALQRCLAGQRPLEVAILPRLPVIRQMFV